MTPYYADDSVTLYHGDCLEVTEWLAADVLLTDPPYGYGHSSGWNGTHQGVVIHGDESEAARDAVLAAWSPRPAIVFGSWKSTPPIGTRTALAWNKGLAAGMGDLSLPWKPNWETIFILGSGFTGSRDSGVITGNVVTWASKGRDHPNQKPVGLLNKLLDKCPPGTITDPFAGSGSTLVAAKASGRHAIGVEIDERYCEATARRLDQGVLAFESA